MDVVTEQWMRERPDLDLYDFLMTLYLLRLARIVETAFGQSCESEFSMGVGDMRVLLALRRNGKPFAQRPTDLFRALLVTSGAMTKQVDRLEAAGLVERLPDPLSNNAVQITLTASGLELVDRASTAIAERTAIGQATSKLTESERSVALNIFRKMLHAMEDTPAALDPPVAKGDVATTTAKRAVAAKAARAKPLTTPSRLRRSKAK
jgi:DNA-binding MarR family transcriptional regulator